MLIYTLFTKRIKSVGDLCLQLESQLSESPWIPPFPELRNILGIIITGCRAAGKNDLQHRYARQLLTAGAHHPRHRPAKSSAQPVAYHTSPKTIEKRIVWQTERAIRAGRPSALVTIMFYGSTPAICRTSASALNNPSPVCVAMCAPERRPCAHRDANHSPRTRRAPYIGNSPPITRLHSKQPGEPTHGALPCVSSPGCQPHQSSERNGRPINR